MHNKTSACIPVAVNKQRKYERTRILKTFPLLPQEDDMDGIHIVAFAEEEDPGESMQLFCILFTLKVPGHATRCVSVTRCFFEICPLWGHHRWECPPVMCDGQRWVNVCDGPLGRAGGLITLTPGGMSPGSLTLPS